MSSTFTAPPLTDELREILSVHHSLWNKEKSLNYRGKNYNTHCPSHDGYVSVILPNQNEYNFLWITQNLNKSSYGTLSINRNRSLGNDERITWIIDNSNGSFRYVGLVNTCDFFNGQNSILIERYTPQGTEVMYSTDPYTQPTRSRY